MVMERLSDGDPFLLQATMFRPLNFIFFRLLRLTIDGISLVQEFNVLWQDKASVVFLTLEIALIFNGAVILPGGLVKAHSDPNSRLEVNISNVLDGCTTFWSVWSQDIAMLSNLNFGRV